MDRRTIRDVAAAVAAGAAVLLLADLSLGWFSVKVAVAGVVDVSANATGWGSTGTVAGLLALAMLVGMIGPVRREGSVTLARAAATGVLGLGAFGFTVARALDGVASVTTPVTAVQVQATQWPTYVGIVLGAAVAGGMITALVLVMQGVRAPSGVIHPTT